MKSRIKNWFSLKTEIDNTFLSTIDCLPNENYTRSRHSLQLTSFRLLPMRALFFLKFPKIIRVRLLSERADKCWLDQQTCQNSPIAYFLFFSSSSKSVSWIVINNLSSPIIFSPLSNLFII